MNKYFKDLYDYELVQRSSKCGFISLKSNFQKKNKLTKD